MSTGVGVWSRARMHSVCVYVCVHVLCFSLCMLLYASVCVYTCPWPLEVEVSSRLLSLIRLQKWVCFLSRLSPACLPLPLSLSNSFCLSRFLLPLHLCLPFWLQRPVACVIQASSFGNTTDHLSHLSGFLPMPLFLSFFHPPIH